MAEPDIGARDDAIAEAYRSGASLRDIAQHAGVTMQRVHQILGKREDVTLRKPYRNYSRPPLRGLPAYPEQKEPER